MKCITCQLHPGGCYCFTCFKANDHRGHKFYYVQSRYGGSVCDCGDPNFLETTGFCRFHSGVSHLSRSLSKVLIDEFQNRLSGLLASLVYFIRFTIDQPASQGLLTKMAELWRFVWNQLIKASDSNQNVLMLTLEVLVNKSLLLKSLSKQKLQELINPILIRLEKFSSTIKQNLQNAFSNSEFGKNPFIVFTFRDTDSTERFA